MKGFVPREKLGKKARKRLDSARRVLWTVPPATKRVESAKRYNRRKKTSARYDDAAVFLLARFQIHGNAAQGRLFRNGRA